MERMRLGRRFRMPRLAHFRQLATFSGSDQAAEPAEPVECGWRGENALRVGRRKCSKLAAAPF